MVALSLPYRQNRTQLITENDTGARLNVPQTPVAVIRAFKCRGPALEAARNNSANVKISKPGTSLQAARFNYYSLPHFCLRGFGAVLGFYAFSC
jgi:hypothetical protein